MRVAPPRIADRVDPAPKPPLASASAEAFRQTGFLLGDDVHVLMDGFELERAVAAASTRAKQRTMQVTATFGAWSRSWLARQQALQALQYGNYPSALMLLAGSIDQTAIAALFLARGEAEWAAWLEAEGIAPAHELHAMEYALAPIAPDYSHPALAGLNSPQRVIGTLAGSSLGGTTLLTASDSTPERALATFGDLTFHMSLAEILLGGLLAVGTFQVEALAAADGIVALPEPEALPGFVAAARARLAVERSYVEVITHEGRERLLVQRWRRRPADVTKRILL